MSPAVLHGESRRSGWTTEFRAWWAMICRCEQKSHARFDRYGGRGIKVCERWRESFEAFLEDVGRRPSPEHSLDRYPDNDGHYEPGNVRWATRAEQNANKTQRESEIVIEHEGARRNLSEWARVTGVACSVIRKRLARGWDANRALTEPTRGTNGR